MKKGDVISFPVAAEEEPILGVVKRFERKSGQEIAVIEVRLPIGPWTFTKTPRGAVEGDAGAEGEKC